MNIKTLSSSLVRDEGLPTLVTVASSPAGFRLRSISTQTTCPTTGFGYFA